MNRYDPLQAPNPEEWQALDEFERNDLVEAFHKESGEDVPEDAEKIHAIIHVIVENQFILEDLPVSATVAKLIRQGLDRHDAIHAVGAILSEDLFNLQTGREDKWDKNKYRRRLEKLTAKRWRKGQW